MNDRQTISIYDEQVEAYQEFADEQSSDPSLLAFIDLIVKNGLVLDLGCGPAVASNTMRNKGLRVDPVDASGEMVRLANKRFNIGARQAHFNDIDTVNHYDGVWASFSLLHATEDEFTSVIKNLFNALKPGAYLHLGMKLGEGSGRDNLGRFYTYYTETELRNHLMNTGFIVGESRTGEGKGLAGNVEPWILITSRTPDLAG